MKDSNPEATRLAQELFEARRQLRNAGRALHDDAGSLLSSAGLRLQILRMDHPEAKQDVAETLELLDQALERVRAMSQELNSSPPAHLGLEKALALLVSRTLDSFDGSIDFSYTASVRIPDDAGVSIYDTVAAVLHDAIAAGRTNRIRISVFGKKDVFAKVSTKGWLWPLAAAKVQARRALPAGIVVQPPTKKSTIVSIRYGPRRPPRG